MRRSPIIRALGCFAFVAVALPAPAQVTTGTISGYVLDPAGRPIPRAVVTASDREHGVSRATTTDPTGLYRLLELAPARYDLAAAFEGFDTSRQPQVQVPVNAQLRVDFRLAMAAIRQTVHVTASLGPPLAEGAGPGAVIDRQAVDALPLNRRDFLQLALLAPGVVPPAEGSELSSRAGFAMHANGAREESNNYLLDGVDNNDPYVHRYVVQPPVDTIQEFRIATNGYGAQYGRSAGGQVNVITRGGRNELDVLGYGFVRDEALDARNYFDGAGKPSFERGQFGLGGGGALARDRTFVFAAVDLLRERRGISRLATVPPMAVRGGDFSSLSVPIVDPFTRAPFPGNVIPAGRISPIARQIVALFPAPNLSGTGPNYLAATDLRDDETQAHVRLDQQVGADDRLTARVSYGLTDAFEPYAEDTQGLPGFGDDLRDDAYNVMVSWQRILGPRAVNSLRAGYNRLDRELQAENHAIDVGEAWGVGWLDLPDRDHGYPALTVAGFSKLGDATSLPIIRTAETWHVAEALTLDRGAHQVQLGGEVRHQRLDGRLDMLTRGSLSFSGAISGNGLGDLLLGFPSFGLQARANNPIALRTTAWGVYVQDDWKPARDLTVSLGLRYEYTTPPVDPGDAMSTFDPATGEVVAVGTGVVTRSGIRPDRNNLAPRVGVAWNAGGEVVLRGGYGVYYDTNMLQVYSSQYFNPPQFTMRVFFPTQYSLLTLADPFPTTGGYAPPPSISAVSPDLVTSFTQHWNATVQRRLPVLGTVTAAYAGSRGSRLVRPRDLNQPEPGPGDVQARRPYPALGGIFFVESAGRSTYHSLQLSSSRQLSRGIGASATYTLAKSMDDASAFLDSTGDRNFPQDSRNVAAEWGPSTYDVRHRFTASVVFQLPAGNAVTRDAELRGIASFNSGQAFTPVLRFDNSNTGNGGQQGGWDRPNLVGDAWLAHPTPEAWFDTAAFAVPARYTFGSAGRNLLRGPGYASVDVSLVKRFRLPKGALLAAELQAFNVLNRTNFELPELFADEPATFGRVLAAKAPRQLQIALRATF